MFPLVALARRVHRRQRAFTRVSEWEDTRMTRSIRWPRSSRSSCSLHTARRASAAAPPRGAGDACTLLARRARGERDASPLRLALVVLTTLGCALVALAPLAYATAGDPFGGITQTINSNARNWAGTLIVLGLLGVCIRYYFGDSDATQHTRGFLWGSIAALAAGLGLAVYDWLSRYVVIR